MVRKYQSGTLVTGLPPGILAREALSFVLVERVRGVPTALFGWLTRRAFCKIITG